MRRLDARTTLVLSLLALAGACSSAIQSNGNFAQGADAGTDGANRSGNTVNGTVVGLPFGVVANAYWIGMPSAGSLPTQVFLLGTALPCSSISTPLWDKALGSDPVLELGVRGMMPNTTYGIGADADASYLPNASSAFNPTADGGTITIAAVNASTNIVGSFDVHFSGDTLKGTFDAAYCATGVEP